VGDHAPSRPSPPHSSGERIETSRLAQGGHRERANLLLQRKRPNRFGKTRAMILLVRDGDEFRRIQRYIEGHPVTVLLAARPERYAWSSRAGGLRGRRRPRACPTNVETPVAGFLLSGPARRSASESRSTIWRSRAPSSTRFKRKYSSPARSGCSGSWIRLDDGLQVGGGGFRSVRRLSRPAPFHTGRGSRRDRCAGPDRDGILAASTSRS